MDRRKNGNFRFRRRQSVFIVYGGEKIYVVARLFKFGGNDVFGFCRGHGEGNEGGGNVELFERTAHRVFSADRGNAEIELSFQRAEQGGKGLSPAGRIFADPFEIFLEGKVNVLKFGARRNEFRKRFRHGEISAVIRTFFGDKRVIAPCHEGTIVRMFLFRGDFLHHRLRGGELIFSAERHKHRACADRGIEAFGKPASGADVQIAR